MDSLEQHIKRLQERLLALETEQKNNYSELQKIKSELNSLVANQTKLNPDQVLQQSTNEDKPKMIRIVSSPQTPSSEASVKLKSSQTKTIKSENDKNKLEDFVGSNLLNKIGIFILVIGISIGAKYAIDHNMIGAEMRIALGYLVSAILVGVGFFIGKKYDGFASVLVGGGFAAFFYLSYVSFSYYGFYSKSFAFVLLLLITCAGSASALFFNKSVLAHIGLVGAYLIPLLLSDGSGSVFHLFIYMATINSGVVFLAYKKEWKSLYINAFVLSTLLISSVLFLHTTSNYLYHALAFIVFFYLQFYSLFGILRIKKSYFFSNDDVFWLLLNNIVFFTIGLSFIYAKQLDENFASLFTLVFAVVNVVFMFFTSKTDEEQLSNRSFLLAMALIYFTAAIPIHFQSNYLLSIWSAEALVLFFFGIKYNNKILKDFSYLLGVLAGLVIIGTWMNAAFLYNSVSKFRIESVFSNTGFYESLFFTIILLAGNVLLKWNPDSLTFAEGKMNKRFLFPLFASLALYFTLRCELVNYFELLIHQNYLLKNSFLNSFGFVDDFPLYHFGILFLQLFTFAFVLFFFEFNRKFIRSKEIDRLNLVLILICLLTVLVSGAKHVSRLQYAFLFHNDYSGWSYIGIHFLFLPFIVYALMRLFSYLKDERLPSVMIKPLTVSIYVLILAFMSFEYVYSMNQMQSTKSAKLGLSIIWTIYSLYLILKGIRQPEKLFRILGLVIIGFTLLKLFFFDIVELTTLAKTIVFICVGVLMLIASYFYNKFKEQLLGKDESNSQESP